MSTRHVEPAGAARASRLGPAGEGVRIAAGNLTVDRRLLARVEGDAEQWHIAERTYTVAVGRAADDPLELTVSDGERTHRVCHGATSPNQAAR